MDTEQRRIVRVFLASPGDLGPERAAARQVVEKINKIWGRKAFNLQIELMGWEETIGSYGRPPQENINADLAKCEVFVGMLWYEWGSSNVGRKYPSGFEEEFRLAEEGHKESGRPAINLLFKQVDEGRPGGTGPGYARIKEFKEEIRQKILWHGFADESEFREKLEAILSDYIIELHKTETQQQPKEASEEAKDTTATPQTAEKNSDAPAQLPSEAITFVSEFAQQASQDSETRPIQGWEISRFRLIGTLLTEQGNDDSVLGVHDANTLFVNASALSLSWRECAALTECGLEHFDAQNVPFWRWLIAANGLNGFFIPIRTYYGSAKQRIGTFKLMRLASQTPCCPGCGETDPECFEQHHIAGRANHDQTQPLCLNCHRKVTSRQKDHPAAVSASPSLLETVGYYLLGLADMLILVAESLVRFGKSLIDQARQQAGGTT